MEIFIEKAVIYGIVILITVAVIIIYVRKMIRESKTVDEKIRIAKEEGLYEPVSLHPVVDPDSCIGSGACVLACPEEDIIGIKNGKATVINASRCVGHGACFHACPTRAISLCIGTEKRGVDLPHVNELFESNVRGIYIAGEIGGMGLIKNAVEQGKQAVENIARSLDKSVKEMYDLIIIGAGPAGISASLAAKNHNLKSLTLEQDSLGGTVFTFPRSKIVMTSPMNLPLYGRVKLKETSKEKLLDLWNEILTKNSIKINEYKKADKIVPKDGGFTVYTKDGDNFHTQKILLAIGRRGSPRKLNIPGENLPKVAYRLLEPELYKEKYILVVGGGDSAVESALLLAEHNNVTLSYRKDKFPRLKQKNKEKFNDALKSEKINLLLNSNLTEINEEYVIIRLEDKNLELKNDLVYIFAGGELPVDFLKNAGIEITQRFGEAVLKHQK